MSDWIDHVPSGWSALPLKRRVGTRITDGPHETPELVDDGVPFLSAEAIQGNALNFDRRRGYITPEAHAEYSRKCRPVRDDILVCKSGATTGKAAMVEADIEFSIWSPLALVRAHRQKTNPRFLFHAIQSEYVQNQIKRRWSAGTQPNIGMGVIENLLIVAPSIDEQRAIAGFLDRETSKIDELVRAKENLILVLSDRRVSTIAEQVFGQHLGVQKDSGNPYFPSARRGVSVAGGIMYVTAFPCHLCARLIVASGIKRVVFIEPYAKSLALQLYPDSITADYEEKAGSQVSFEPFVGIAPRKYIELFTMKNRKDANGKAIPFDRAIAFPRLVGSPRSYLAAEAIAFAELEKVIQRKQLMNEQQELPRV